MRGPPLVVGVGSVTRTFIWAIPPGGTVSSGICNEICRVADVHDPPAEPPLVDPDVPEVLVLVPDPPLVDPDVLCASAPRVRRRVNVRTAQPN